MSESGNALALADAAQALIDDLDSFEESLYLCDHSVGICACALRNLRDALQARVWVVQNRPYCVVCGRPDVVQGHPDCPYPQEV